ncbi:MAG: DnaJ C-terminal domain-containing protein, partial [Corynebacterium sp.]
VEVQVKEHNYFLRDADDLHVTVNVPMVDAALGTTVEVPLLDDSVATVTVEPGTQPEAVVRVKGKGMPHLRREGHGSLVAHVDVTVPTELDKKQRDLLEQFRGETGHVAGLQSSGDEHSGGLFSRLRQKFGR